jgi:PAS domain-containing protein
MLHHNQFRWLLCLNKFAFLQGAADEAVSPRARAPSGRASGAKASPLDELPPLDILAQQMTMAEYRYFSAIKLSDFFGSAWLKSGPNENATASFIEHSNSISRWMATKVLVQPTKQGRAKVIGKFIKLIDNLKEMSNLSSMMTVYMSLQLHCISRLKKTWKNVPKALRQQFQRHEAQLRPMSNFSGYRDTLAKASLPCIPYIGITAKDIVALDELPTYEEEETKHINWFKMTQISKVLLEQVLKFKKADYHFEEVPDVFAEMMNPEIVGLLDEDRLIEQSILIEPDDASERQQHSTHAPQAKDLPPAADKREGSLSGSSAAGAAALASSSSDRTSSPAKGSPRQDHDAISIDTFSGALIQGLYNVYHRTLTSTGSLQAEDHSGELVTLTVDMLHLLSQLGSVNLKEEATKVITIGTLLKQVCSVVTEMSSGRQRFLFETSLDYRSKVTVSPRVIALAALAFTYSASAEFGHGAGHRVFYLTSQDAGDNQLRVRAIVAQSPLVTGEISASAASAAQLLALPVTEAIPPSLLNKLAPFQHILKGLGVAVTRVSDSSAFAFTLTLSRSSGVVADTSRILSRLHSKDVKTWTVDDVCDWIIANSTVDSKWSSLFSSNVISGAELTTLSESDIIDMGIPRAHARVILKEISALSTKSQPRSQSLQSSLSGNQLNSSSAGSNLADSRADSETSESSTEHPAAEWTFNVKCGTSSHKVSYAFGATESKPSFESILVAIKNQLPTPLGIEYSSVKKRNFVLSYLDSEGDSMDVDSVAAYSKSCDYILEDSPEGGAFLVRLHAVEKAGAAPSPPGFDMADFLEKYKDSSDAVVLTKGDAANIQFINSAATRQFGLAMTALLDVPVEAVLVQPFEYYRELFSAGQLPANTVLLGSAGPINVKITLQRIAGDHWVWTIIPLQEAPANTSMPLHEYRDKLETTAEPSLLLSSELLIEAFNPAACDIFHHQYSDVFRKPIALLLPQFQREVADLVKQADESVNKEATSGSLLCQRKDGSLFVAAMTVRQQTDIDSSKFYVVKFVVA